MVAGTNTYVGTGGKSEVIKTARAFGHSMKFQPSVAGVNKSNKTTAGSRCKQSQVNLNSQNSKSQTVTRVWNLPFGAYLEFAI